MYDTCENVCGNIFGASNNLRHTLIMHYFKAQLCHPPLRVPGAQTEYRSHYRLVSSVLPPCSTVLLAAAIMAVEKFSWWLDANLNFYPTTFFNNNAPIVWLTWSLKTCFTCVWIKVILTLSSLRWGSL